MYLDDIGFTEMLGMLFNLRTSGQNCLQIIPKGQAELNDELKKTVFASTDSACSYLIARAKII